jgi:hypothetical protein
MVLGAAGCVLAVRLTLPAVWHGMSRRTRSLPAPVAAWGGPLVPGKCPRWPLLRERARDLVMRVAMSAVVLVVGWICGSVSLVDQMPGKTSSLSSENFCSCSSE